MNIHSEDVFNTTMVTDATGNYVPGYSVRQKVPSVNRQQLGGQLITPCHMFHSFPTSPTISNHAVAHSDNDAEAYLISTLAVLPTFPPPLCESCSFYYKTLIVCRCKREITGFSL